LGEKIKKELQESEFLLFNPSTSNGTSLLEGNLYSILDGHPSLEKKSLYIPKTPAQVQRKEKIFPSTLEQGDFFAYQKISLRYIVF